MLYYRASNDRGYAEVGGWLRSYHTFSFADYYDPRFMGFHDLRVINQDWISANAGFPTHPHKNMEIITYILKGAVEHRDSMGNVGQIKAGEIQVMHAGAGIRHSEANPSSTETLELFQIWIQPDTKDVEPGYTQQSFTKADKLNQLRLLVSKDGRESSQKIHQDVDLYACVLETQKVLDFKIRKNRGIWLQVAKGEMEVNGMLLNDGDGLAIEKLESLQMKAYLETEFLLFDLR